MSDLLRDPKELHNIRDCVEEVLVIVTYYASISGLVRHVPGDGEHPGDMLYNNIEAILRRAQELPREDASGSRSPTATPPALPA